MGVTAAVVGSAAISVGAGMYQANQQKIQMNKQADAQTLATQQLEQDAKNKTDAQNKANAAAASDAASEIAAHNSAQSLGKRSTILTSPLGITSPLGQPGASSSGNKTVLGS